MALDNGSVLICFHIATANYLGKEPFNEGFIVIHSSGLELNIMEWEWRQEHEKASSHAVFAVRKQREVMLVLSF